MDNIVIDLNKELHKIDIEDKNELLKWFMKAYYVNDILASPTFDFYSCVYELLKDKYLPITEDIKTIELKREIKEGSKNPTQSREATLLIGQIMIGVKGKIGITHDVIKELINYHSKYNPEFLNELYMKEIKNNIGKNVHITGRHGNVPFIEEGVIEKVNKNNFVTIDNYEGNIPFVGFKHYIIQIKDKEGKVIYNNPIVIDPNTLIDTEDITSAKHKIMGVKPSKTKSK